MKGQDKLFRIYQDTLSKGGDFSLEIFKKVKTEINKKLNILLKDFPFKLYFDNNNKLKIIDNRNSMTIIRGAKDGSGMERTFSVLSLKLVFREFLNNIKLNFMTIDEVTGTLDGESKILMANFLNLIKRKMDFDYIFLIDQDILPMEYLNPDSEIMLEYTTEGTMICQDNFLNTHP
jgi:DNA repair exonuclease SbcCD ATPase subunit